MSEDTAACVLTIETAGNQSYIFASNKLREQIGASQLLHEATTVWLLEALGWSDPTVADDPSAFHDALRKQQPLDRGAGREIVQAPSGRAIVVFRDRAEAIAVGRAVTERALRTAPGLEVSCGIAPVDWSAPGGLDEAIRQADRDRGRRSAAAPGALARHLRLPIVADCNTSAFPAAARDHEAADANEGPRPPARSAAARAKRLAAKRGVQRMARALGDVTGRIAANPDDLLRLLEKTLEEGERIGWLAVVHADGNGIGERLMNHANSLAKDPNAKYLKKMRKLSLDIDAAALAALRAATGEMLADDGLEPASGEILPLVPFIVGGDDLTVLLAGADALSFVRTYLQAAAERKVVCRAGIAFVKPRYPLHSAYDLSSALADSAKAAKQHEVPAFDFHLLYDTGLPDLTAIRNAMLVDDGATRLHGRPYVVADPSHATPWVARHSYALVEDAPDQVVERDESGERMLPRSQLAALRTALQRGHEIADQQLRLVAERYPKGLTSVTVGSGATQSLFVKTDEQGEPSGSSGALLRMDVPKRPRNVERFTRLADVIDLVELASLPSLTAVAADERKLEPA